MSWRTPIYGQTRTGLWISGRDRSFAERLHLFYEVLYFHPHTFINDEALCIDSLASAIQGLEPKRIKVKPMINVRYDLSNGLRALELDVSKGTLKVIWDMEGLPNKV